MAKTPPGKSSEVHYILRAKVSRLLGSATILLTLLTNPLNVTLLSSQLLFAPAIWYRPDGLRTPIGVLSIFSSASIHICREKSLDLGARSPEAGRTLDKEVWITAVIKGADDQSPRWRHLLALGGLLLGITTPDGQEIQRSVRHTIEGAIVKAVNLALHGNECEDTMAAKAITVVLSHVFDHLGDEHKLSLHHDLLLPKLYQPPLFDKEGLHSGYFLSTMDADVVESAANKFDWSTRSSTYVRMQRITSGPLISSLGPISRLIAFSAENVQNVDLLAVVVEDFAAFARCLCVQWRQNKLSEVDVRENAVFLTDESLRTSLPLLWKVLNSSMFTTVIVLRSILGRVLCDPRLPMDMRKLAPG